MAEHDPTTHGYMLRTKDGNYIQNPLVGSLNVLTRDAARLAAEFGLTASARTQIAAGASAEDDPILRKYGLG